MQFPIKTVTTALAAATLSACDPMVDTQMISATGVSVATMSKAQQAAQICAQNAPNWVDVENALKVSGFAETQDERLTEIARAQRAAILENASEQVVVLVGSRGGEGACIVGARGMTPQQSFQLASPWAEQFDLQTNEERGQGLANNAVQAWGRIDDTGVIFTAAYKTWDVLDEPGAAARLLMTVR